MAKKAKKVSWRTLTRQADKERSPRRASALRKQAWAARRADRAAKRKTVKKAAPGRIVGVAQAGAAHVLRSAFVEQVGEQVAAYRGRPGQGELVGGVFSQHADRIAKLARKKGGTDAIQNELAALAATSKHEGCVETGKAATKRLIEAQQILADRIVCGFVAKIEYAMKFHRGGLPPDMVLAIDSFTISKIVDALNKAGYTSRGTSPVDAKERAMSVDR